MIYLVETHHALETESVKELLGIVLVVLGMLPRDVLGTRIYCNPDAEGKLLLFLETIDNSLDYPEAFFPRDLLPLVHACSLASSITGRLYAADGELFGSTQAMDLASSIAFKVWTLNGVSPNPTHPRTEKWNPSAMAAVNLMRNLLDDVRGRKALMRYCAADGITRWDNLVDWLRERTKLLQSSSDSNPEDVYDVTVVTHILQKLSAQVVLRLSARTSLSQLSKALNHHQYGNVSHLMTAVEIVHATSDLCLKKLSGYPFMWKVASLIGSGILIPIREVVCLTMVDSPVNKVKMCWRIFFASMNMILHPQTIRLLHRASEDLDADGTHHTTAIWDTFVGTAKLFASTHTYKKGSPGNGFCDNPTVCPAPRPCLVVELMQSCLSPISVYSVTKAGL
jgi:hypothetical protein